MKLTDNEIINCLNDTVGKEHIGIYCSDKNGNYTTTIRLVDIIDLIIRLKAENERLKNLCQEQNKEIKRLQQIKSNMLVAIRRLTKI